MGVPWVFLWVFLWFLASHYGLFPKAAPLPSRRGLRDTAGRGPAAAAEVCGASVSCGQRDAEGAAGGGETGHQTVPEIETLWR